MKKITKNSFLFAVTAASALLASCTPESNNLPNPPVGVGERKCSALTGVTCVSGRFIDAAVFRLNYECGEVRSVTTVDGGFSCPNGSEVTFLISHPDVEKKAVLGTYKVQSRRLGLTGSQASIIVTPASLVADGDRSNGNPFPLAAENIARLLQTLDDGSVTTGNPTKVISLKESEKKIFLGSLLRSMTPDDFSTESGFEALVLPALALFAPAKPLVSLIDARAAMKTGILTARAGIYSVPNPLMTTFEATIDVADMVGRYSSGSSNKLISAVWIGVDRKGRMFGNGFYSKITASTPLSGLPLLKDPKPMALDQSSLPRWTIDGKVQGLAFDMDSGERLIFTQGELLQDAMRGSTAPYKSYYGDTFATDPEIALRVGRFEVKSGASTVLQASHSWASLERTRPVTPTLDPDVWSALSFPIRLSVQFNDSQPASTVCPAGCPVGVPLRLDILADGSIVSDTDNDCTVVDADTFVDFNGTTERLVGVVAEAFSVGETSERYLNLVFIVPNDEGNFGDLAGVHAGTVAGNQALVSLRVDASAPPSARYQMFSDETVNGVRLKSLWTNVLSLFAALGKLDPANINETELQKSRGRMTSRAVSDTCN
ncbi:MAG: hypothetical protein Q8J78_11970 [Moraxellaceae bacterium]|nr:hypothetical protein [Moraxellaceae bacterium]